jgi:O-acetyl-ADP-ribose deacetylase (regulator of RNase III)
LVIGFILCYGCGYLQEDHMSQIQVVNADITTLTVDAIVNAANHKLAGGGGVDGAIHRVAGPELLKECLKLGGCPTGAAKLTAGYRLPARYVIHAVGPVWQGGHHQEAELLASCYRQALTIAVRHNIRTIAFAAISCGVYHFPLVQAAQIAVAEVSAFLDQQQTPEQVIFACLDPQVYSAFSAALSNARSV